MKPFYAKILLFGEYSVLTGSSAITVPYKKFSGQLRLPDNVNSFEEQQGSNMILKNLYSHLVENDRLEELYFDFEKFRTDLDKGLYFESSIPQHYGVGSSGALVAAVFENYCNTDLRYTDFTILKKILADAESLFHGSSSGIDPLSSLLGMPLFFKENTVTLMEDKKIADILSHFYLFDTKTEASTINFVSLYLTRYSDVRTKSSYKKYCNLVDEAAEELIMSNIGSLTRVIAEISRFQYESFREMIPERIRSLWYSGLQSGDFHFKLCGSGGGGYMLIFSTKPEKELNALVDDRVIPVETL